MNSGNFREKDRLFNLIKRVFLIFAIIAGVGLFSYFVYLAANAYSGNVEVKITYPSLFSDFTQVAYYAVHKNAYLLEGGSSYPALSLLMMLPFALIFKEELAQIAYTQDWASPINLQLVSSYRFWIAFLLYQTITLTVFYLLLRKWMGKENTSKANTLFLIFICSAPFLFSVVRGNVVVTSLIFALAFLIWYRSEKAWQREVALICLAVASVTKLYPLFLCAFLLYDKKWFATARMFLYFFVLYLVPMFIYEGGVSAYFKNFLDFAGGGRAFVRSNISLASLFCSFVQFLSKLFHFPFLSWAEQVGSILGIVFLLFAASAAVVTKSHLKRSVLALCSILLVPSASFFYAAVFGLIPLVFYLKNNEKTGIAQNVIFFVFCMLFGFYPIYTLLLYKFATVVALVLGVAMIVTVFKNREFSAYFNDLKTSMINRFKKEKEQ